MRESDDKNTGIQAVGQLIAAVVALLWEIFRPQNDKERR